MANEESNKLKVPPLKIVLSSHQNNAVVNISNIDNDQFKSNEKDDNSNDHLDHKELGRRNSLDANDGCEKHHKKNSKGSSERKEFESGQPSSRTGGYSSSSSSSSSSDRSSSTTPSSESESLASNSTIISEHQHVKNRIEHKDDASPNKQDRISRYNGKVSSAERSTSNFGTPSKKSQDGNAEQGGDTTASSSRDQILNANQRITRSSQRAAQQSKTENLSEPNCEDSIVSENLDKTHESARKVKRRKGEPHENEQDGQQATAQPTVIMANIYPADYQLPSQNSFELYRDIRKRPYKKLMKLNYIQPRAPHGFKEYLLNGGPYLLDGNKLGVGLNGSRFDSLNNTDQSRNGISSTSREPLRTKLSNFHQKPSSYHTSQLRHTSYIIPKISETPKNLQFGSPLYELFQDQEKQRYQMRMQHLKERERSILTAEQEILRAYNKAAIADIGQKLHLSACTYFYYQERYHYLDEKSGSNGNANSKEVPHSQDNSFLCIEGGEATKSTDDNASCSTDSKNSSADNKNSREVGNKSSKDEKNPQIDSSAHNKNTDLGIQIKKENAFNDLVISKTGIIGMGNMGDELRSKNVQKETLLEVNGAKPDTIDSCPTDIVMTHNANSKHTTESSGPKDGEVMKSEKIVDQVKNLDLGSDNSISDSSNCKEDPTKKMSDEELKVINKEIFLNQLQEIDDKWDKIKKDMLMRHKNEADSLHAVQSLEWEWKAKEIGACDVRVSLKIEPEFVPTVEVVALDY